MNPEPGGMSRAIARVGDEWRRIGGRRWLQGPARLTLVLIVVLVGFLPYNHEIAGDCRLVPAAQRGVRAQLSDEITQVLVTEGDWVEAGSVIVRLSARDVTAEIASTEAELVRAQANLEQLESGPRAEEIEWAEHEVELLRAELDFHEVQLRRQIELNRQDAATDEDVDEARRLRDATRHAKAAAESHLAKLRSGSREEEILAARAQVAHFEALLEKQQRDLELTELRAPISGRVVTPHVRDRVGQVTAEGDLILVVQDTSRLGVSIKADQEAAARVRKGMEVKVRLRALDGALVRGRVEGIAEEVDAQPQIDTVAIRSDREIFFDETLDRDAVESLRVLATLDEQAEHLMPGMTGKARIVVGQSVLWAALIRPVVRFLRTEVWSWLP